MIVPPFYSTWREEPTSFDPDARAVWRALVSRQRQAVQAHGASAFLRQLRRLDSSLCQNGLPDLIEIAQLLNAATGWTVDWSPSNASGNYDFGGLARRSVRVSTLLRDRQSFDHPASPDLFHDVFGRLPALMCGDFADLMHLIGRIGTQLPVNTSEFHQLQLLCQRLFESSLVPETGDSLSGSYKLFGASLVSDFQKCISAPDTEINAEDYNFNALMAPFPPSGVELRAYRIPSWRKVGEDLIDWFKARKSSLRPDPLCSGTVQCS